MGFELVGSVSVFSLGLPQSGTQPDSERLDFARKHNGKAREHQALRIRKWKSRAKRGVRTRLLQTSTVARLQSRHPPLSKS
jgi:hypothetical protein